MSSVIFLGNTIGFLTQPQIIAALTFAVALPLLWKNAHRFVLASTAVALTCLATGSSNLFYNAFRYNREFLGLDISAARDAAAIEAATKQGLLIPLAVIAIFTLFFWRFRRSKIAWFMAPALLLILASYYGNKTYAYFTPSNPELTKAIQTPASQSALGIAPQDKRLEMPPAQETTLVVTSATESSEGATADDINSDFVTMIEQHFEEMGKKHYQIAMKNLGYPGESIDYDVGTTFFDEGGEKLAVTTLEPTGKGAITKIAWWIIGGEIKRVACVDTAGNAVPIRFGSCAERISEVFGYKNWSLDSRVRQHSVAE